MNIDTSKIEGYAEMSAEQKIAALESYTFETDHTGYVKKETFDKTASELAEWKRKHNALLSEEEKKKLEDEQKYSDLQNELETLRKEKSISTYKASFLSKGYDEELATKAANAMADGNTSDLFATLDAFKASIENSAKASALASMKDPKAGSSDEVMTKEKFLKMPTDKQLAYMADHPNWQTELK